MIIYKYLHSDRVDFFSSFKLRFTPPKDLNDIRELRPEIIVPENVNYFDSIYQMRKDQYVKEQIELNPALTVKEITDFFDSNKPRMEKKYPFINNFEQFAYEKLMEAINYVGVLSLTEKNDEELMWSHYANSHKGIVIGLDNENIFFSPKELDPPPSGKLIKVQYSDIIPRIIVEPYVQEIPEELFFTKTCRWKYEREWRMIKLLITANEIIEKKIHLFEVPLEAIKEVIFGMNMSKEVREDIKSKIKLRTNQILFKEAILNTNGEFRIV